MTDEKIDEIYILALQAKRAALAPIQVHIFPFRMNAANTSTQGVQYPDHVEFWKEIQPIYDYFEKNRTLPKVKVNSKGAYAVAK
jgi:murein L,D-transpeptidase YafK